MKKEERLPRQGMNDNEDRKFFSKRMSAHISIIAMSRPDRFNRDIEICLDHIRVRLPPQTSLIADTRYKIPRIPVLPSGRSHRSMIGASGTSDRLQVADV